MGPGLYCAVQQIMYFSVMHLNRKHCTLLAQPDVSLSVNGKEDYLKVINTRRSNSAKLQGLKILSVRYKQMISDRGPIKYDNIT